MTEPSLIPTTPAPASNVESFLQALEAKTTVAAHRRLLLAARNKAPLEAMNVELAKIATEILNAP